MDPTRGLGFSTFQGKRMGYAFRQHNGYYKNLMLKSMLNPATLLHTETGPPEHDCIETIHTIYSSCPNLGSEPLPNTEEEGSRTGSIMMSNVWVKFSFIMRYPALFYLKSSVSVCYAQWSCVCGVWYNKGSDWKRNNISGKWEWPWGT